MTSATYAESNSYSKISDQYLEYRFGISPSKLDQLTDKIILLNSSKPIQSSKLEIPKNFKVKGSDIVNFLIANPQYVQSENLFKVIIDQYYFLLAKKTTSLYSEQDIQVLSYLSDLLRDQISIYKKTSWYDFKNGFLDITAESRNDFDFQNGDLVLGFGSQGVSALATETTTPKSPFSHALIVKKQLGVITTLESQPHTGAHEFTKSAFDKESYYHMLVMRLRSSNDTIISGDKVTSLAEKWAKKNIEFDTVSDLSDDSKFGCMEMAGKSLAYSQNKTLQDFFNYSDFVTPGFGVKVVKDIGFSLQPRIMTGRSFLRSDFLSPIAEYRNTDNLLQTWTLHTLADYTQHQYNEEHRLIQDRWLKLAIQYLPKIPFLDSIPFIKKVSTIAGLVGVDSFSKLATFETLIAKPLIRKNQKLYKNIRFSHINIREFYANSFKELFENTNNYFEAEKSTPLASK